MNDTTYFEEKLETLPDHIRWAIQAVDYKSALEEIKKKYRLHIDQAATLEKLCQLFMLGDIDATGFVNNMFTEGHLSSQVAGEMLVDIDTLILKKIRGKIETFEHEEAEVIKNRDEYLEDSEKEINEVNTLYREQDDRYVKVEEEVENELRAEGFLDDGSNVTEEDIAKEYGMTPAEYLAQFKDNSVEGGAIQAARNTKDKTPEEVDLSKDTLSEKESLLKELESPQKSFATPLFTPIVKIENKAVTIKPSTPITPDHQLQNTHVEEPFHDEINTVTPEERAQVSAKIPEPVVNPRPISTHIEPAIKKPAKIDLTHDVYREPIE
jgi:hypothetical protein